MSVENKCHPTNPCENGGKCSNTDDDQDYKCECPPTWFGKDCNIASENPCNNNPCLHGGTCLPSNLTDYSCKCEETWTGKNCERRLLCETVFKELCSERCTFNHETKTVFCRCDQPNEYFNYLNKTCKKVDSCALMVCQENEVCWQDTCICKPGFFEETDKNNKTICIPKMGCETSEAALKECQSINAICVSNSEKAKGFECECASGFQMEEKRCIEKCEMKQNIEMCLRRNMKCYVEDIGEVFCRCPRLLQLAINESDPCKFVKFTYRIKLPIMRKKYDQPNSSGRIQGKKLQEDTVVTRELKMDIMKTIRTIVPILHQTDVLSCTFQQDIIMCSVIVISPDEIRNYLELIYGTSTCVTGNELVSKDFCLLESGVPLKASEISAITITEVDVCDEELKLCGANAICSKSGNFDYECTCQEGYVERSFEYHKENDFLFRSCKAIDACGKSSDKCPNTTECVNYKEDYYCDCIPGYKLKQNRTKEKNKDDCEVINVCIEDSNICPNTTTCVYNEGDYYCRCKPGYRLKENKTVEENKEDCEDLCDPNPCKMGICKRHSDGVFCSCNTEGIGPFCEEDKRIKKCTVNIVIACVVFVSTLLLALICASIAKRQSKKSKGNAAENIHSSESKPGEEMVQMS